MISSNKIIIGTANFFNLYGIDNSSSFQHEKITEFFEKCEVLGIDTVDLAIEYNNLDKLIPILSGFNFKCILKIKAENKKQLEDVRQQVKFVSEKNINIDTLMIHNTDFLFLDLVNRKKILEKIIYIQSENNINNIGISVYSPNELSEALVLKDTIKVFQLPVCPGDDRWSEINRKSKDENLQFHFRSVFLQGRLFRSPDQNHDLPVDVQELCSQWYSTVKSKKVHVGAAALNIIHKKYKFGTHFVIGIETINHLTELIDQLNVAVLDFPYRTKSISLDIRNWIN